MIIKRDNSREPFSREKLTNGLLRACEKRPISLDDIDAVIDKVESRIYGGMEREVSSKVVGEITLEYLKGSGRGRICTLCLRYTDSSGIYIPL